jgi:internalin A
MKVCKHLKLNKNPASTLPGFRPLGTLALFLFVSSFPVQAVGLQEATTPRTFADWCLNKNNLSVETLHTINALLQVAKTTDCNQASKLLSPLTTLTLFGNQISDLRPLSSLTNLAGLSLTKNQISDLRPLSSLTNLSYLYLDNNQIADLRPLSTLTNLSYLYLSNNPTLTDKTCPIKPASICRFASDLSPSR